MLKPTSSSLRRAALAAAVVGSLSAPAAAQAAPSEATYSVTFRGEMTDKWHATERFTDDCKLTGAMCVRDMKGAGSAKLAVRTRRPTKVLVFRGLRGKPPTISMGATPGIPVTGSLLRAGSLVTDYSGPWEGANPDRKAPDAGCGNHPMRGHVTFSWQARNQLGIVPILGQEPDDCPDGPGEAWTWDDDESPSVLDVIGQVAQTKFLRTRQFTVSGKRTWNAVIPAVHEVGRLGTFDKEGTRSVTWRWEATFRMDGGRKKKRRR